MLYWLKITEEGKGARHKDTGLKKYKVENALADKHILPPENEE